MKLKYSALQSTSDKLKDKLRLSSQAKNKENKRDKVKG